MHGAVGEVDDFEPVAGDERGAGVGGRGGTSVDRELAATDRRHGGSDGALEGERGDDHTSPAVQRRQLLRVRANHERAG